jgi:NADH-quinone oxidoreductase subunit N
MRVLPELIMGVAATLLMVIIGIAGERGRNLVPNLALAALVAGIGGTLAASSVPGFAFHDMVIVDGFTTFFRFLVIGVGILALLSARHYLQVERAEAGEYYALLLFCVVGQSFMAAAGELMMVFIGLEISSIATYIMAGYLRDDRRSNESALKYFLLGSFATAFLLYGIAWMYGLTGSTNLLEIRRVLMLPNGAATAGLVGTAAALMFVGFGFKISAAPFQVWAPDVYQGAPAPAAAFLSAGPKAAAFAILLRVYITAFTPVADIWIPVLWTSALLTMFVGNLAALAQTNIKRLLAYSSIAHAGYVLVAVTATSIVGVQAALFYLAAYAFMNIGAFAVVTHFARRGERYVEINDLAGYGYKQPVVAGMMTLFLLSLIGVPLTAGFFGKFYIFKAALDANLIWLTILGLVNSAVAAYYYLRIIVVMYMYAPTEAVEGLPRIAPGLSATIAISAAATLVLGIFPNLLLDYAGQSAVLIK